VDTDGASQRWKKGHVRWRRVDDRPIVRRGDLETLPSKDVIAVKRFVATHHYAGTTSSPVRCFELWQTNPVRNFESWEDYVRVGVAVFSNCARAYRPPFGEHPAWLTLGRLVLLEEVGANAESMFVAACFAALRREGYEGIVSFSDPVPRTRADGRVIFLGHAGFIYRGLNAVYTGRSKSETKWLLPDGTLFETRAANKIKVGDIGRDYAERVLVAHGASPIQRGDDPTEWVARWRAQLCRPFIHRGNLRYLWSLDKRARKHLPAGLPYPKFKVGVGLVAA
jgi:hypothetical protein